MNQSSLNKTVFINAAPEIVWMLLTDKDQLGTWYHPADADLKEGADYTLYSKDDKGERLRQIWGHVLKLQPHSLLEMTFCIEPFGGNESTLIWQLDELAGGTRVSLTHHGIVEATGGAAAHLLTALDKGWDTHLSDLREIAAVNVAAA